MDFERVGGRLSEGFNGSFNMLPEGGLKATLYLEGWHPTSATIQWDTQEYILPNGLDVLEAYCQRQFARAASRHAPASESTRSEATAADGRDFPTTLAANLDLLRSLAGLSFDGMADLIGLDKTNVTDHVVKGTKPRPSTLRAYVLVFNEQLGCGLEVPDLRLPTSKLRERIATTQTPPAHRQ